VVLVISSHDAADNPSPEPFRGGTNHPVEPPTSALREGIGRYLLPRLGLPFPPPDPSRQRQLRTQQHSRSPRPAGSGRSARFSSARPSQWRSCGGGAVPRSRAQLLSEEAIPSVQAGPIFRSCGPIDSLYTDGIHPYTAAGQACLAKAIQQALKLESPSPRR
jgi:hypothetical protein